LKQIGMRRNDDLMRKLAEEFRAERDLIEVKVKELLQALTLFRA
jgi:hypothetical protein